MKNKQIVVRLEEKLYKLLSQYADKEKISISQAVRHIINDYIQLQFLPSDGISPQARLHRLEEFFWKTTERIQNEINHLNKLTELKGAVKCKL